MNFDAASESGHAIAKSESAAEWHVEKAQFWVRNGSIYLTLTRELEEGRLIADDVHGYEMPRERSFDVDTAGDLAFAEFLLARGDVELPDGTGDPRAAVPQRSA